MSNLWTEKDGEMFISNDLPALPLFTVHESYLGMTHHEWINILYAYIYSKWNLLKSADPDRLISKRMLLEKVAVRGATNMLARTILSSSELAKGFRIGGMTDTQLSQGLISKYGADAFISQYKQHTRKSPELPRRQLIERQTRLLEAQDQHALALGKLVLEHGLLLLDPQTGLKVDPRELEL